VRCSRFVHRKKCGLLPEITVTSDLSLPSEPPLVAAQQAAMNSGDNNTAWIIAIGMMAYQMGTNSADLRTWLTLPKRVLYASFAAPADGQVSVELSDGRAIGPIATESDGLTIVHVRSPGPAAEPAVRTMRIPVR